MLHRVNNDDIFMQTLYDAYISSLCLPRHAIFKDDKVKEHQLSRLLNHTPFNATM